MCACVGINRLYLIFLYFISKPNPSPFLGYFFNDVYSSLYEFFFVYFWQRYVFLSLAMSVWLMYVCARITLVLCVYIFKNMCRIYLFDDHLHSPSSLLKYWNFFNVHNTCTFFFRWWVYFRVCACVFKYWNSVNMNIKT